MYAILSRSGNEEKILAKLPTSDEAREAISWWRDAIAEETSEKALEEPLVTLAVVTLH